MSEVASGIHMLGGSWGMEWRAKVGVQNEGTVWHEKKPKTRFHIIVKLPLLK